MALRSRRPQPQSAAPKPSRAGSTRSKSTRSKPEKGKKRPRRRSANAGSTMPKDGERLQKILAAAGLGSRRACEELILTGRVEVDRQTVSTLGSRVDPVSQEIRVDGEPLPRPRATYVLVHKVQGVLSTANDPSGRPRVTDMVPPTLGRLFPVGRLDMSSEGLILLTNDGELANRMTHPRYGIEKTYHVQVAGHIEPETLRELEKGIYLAEGVAKVVGASIKSHHKNSTILEMILDEGRNREIRRLLARVGHKVQRLTRVAMGPLKLGDVPPGAYRLLRRDEIEALKNSVEEVPAGKRATKRPRANASGSRKLLEKRKSDSAGKQTEKGAKSSGRPSSKPQHRKTAKSSMDKGPKPRTVIGDDGDSGSGTSYSKQRASAAKNWNKNSTSGQGRGAKTGIQPNSPGKFGAAKTGRTILSDDDSFESSSAGSESKGSSSANRRKAKPNGRNSGGGRSSARKTSGAKAKQKGKPGTKSGRSTKK